MPSRTPADWHGLHAELERLLAEGQAEPVRLLIQARFLREVLPQGDAVWAAYGFPVARSFAQRIGGEPARGGPGSLREMARCGKRFLSELEDTLQECASRSAPPWAQETEWSDGLQAAGRALQRERESLGRIVSGGGPVDVSVSAERLRAERVRVEGPPTERPSTHGSSTEGRPNEDTATPPIGSSSVLVPVILGVQSGRKVPELFQGIRASCLVLLTVEAQLLYRRARGAELTVQGSADPQTVAGFEEAAAFFGRLAPPGTP